MKTIRIFISSPGDVAIERDKARKVVEGLQKRYAGRLRLETVLWEDLPLGAVDSFQGGIDVMLKGEQAIDIAVFILWSRLGSPLGATIRKPDGSAYRSGTEREFDLMLGARTHSADGRPEILVYVRQDDRRFKAALQDAPTDQIEELLRQHKQAEQFIREQFHDSETGSNLRAYHTFPEPNSFAERLKTHLRSLLDTIALDGGLGFGTWEGSPYRGLEVFRSEHAPIFFGRDEEVCEALERLRAQAETGCAFLLLVGASGSGKSSLARAGILPALETDNLDESVTEWRTATLTPSECAEGLCRALARVLLERIPELRSDANSLTDLEEALRDGRGKALTLLLRRACAGSSVRGSFRLVLLIDQLEELFTHAAIAEAEANAFLAALQALAVSGCVWVLATVRSDFYDRCQRFPVLMAMKGNRGQMDLLPPEPSDIHRIITGPAVLAGLAFEKNVSGESLDQRILNDAVGHPEALPLIEFALAQLYETRTVEGLLTFAAYDKLGGVEGAIGRHAEAVFAALSEAVRTAFGPVFIALVALDESDKARPVRRRVTLEALAATPERRQLVDALLAARLLTSDRGEVFVAHEALLRRWERAVQWIEANRDRLRVRDRIAARMAEDALLGENDPLTSLARHHLAECPDTFDPAQRDYIAAQIARIYASQRRRERVRRTVVAGLSVLTLLAVIGGVLALWQWRAADRARENSEVALAISKIRLVNGYVEKHAFASARETLNQIPSGHRNLEWALLMEAASPYDWAFHVTNRGRIEDVAVSPDGMYVAVTSFPPGGEVRSARDGSLIGEMNHNFSSLHVNLVGFLENDLFVTMSDGYQLWQVNERGVRCVDSDLREGEPHMASKCMVTVDESKEVILLKQILEHKEVALSLLATNAPTLTNDSDAESRENTISQTAVVSFLHDNQYASFQSIKKGVVEVWNLKQKQALCKLNGSFVKTISVDVDSTGRMATVVDHSTDTLHLFALPSGSLLRTISVPISAPDGCFSCKIVPGAKWVAYQDHQFRVHLYSTDTGQEASHVLPGAVLSSCSISPDGSMYLSDPSDGHRRVYRISDGTVQLEGSFTKSAIFINDGKQVVQGSDALQVEIYNLKTNSQRQAISLLDGWMVTALSGGIIILPRTDESTWVNEVGDDADSFLIPKPCHGATGLECHRYSQWFVFDYYVDRAHFIAIFDSLANRYLFRRRALGTIDSVEWFPKQKKLFVQYAVHELVVHSELIDLVSGEAVRMEQMPHVKNMFITKDGSRVGSIVTWSGDRDFNNVLLWDARDGAYLGSFKNKLSVFSGLNTPLTEEFYLLMKREAIHPRWFMNGTPP
jgi:WD40 repeat protein